MVYERAPASVRKSTYNWIRNQSSRLNEHESMVEKFEMFYDENEIVDHSLDPISILCIDGGGMRGTFTNKNPTTNIAQLYVV